MKMHSFRQKILCALLAFSMLLTITICVTVGVYYKHKEMQKYNSLAYSYAKTASEYIDGDRVLSYVESNQPDDYYEQVMDFLNSTQAQTDIRYYYVFVPYENDLVYVWDANNEEGACPLGYHESYMEGGKEASFRAMEGNAEEEIYVTNDETYGYIASAYYPIYNSAGESVALVGVDLSMPNINLNLLYFMMVIILCVVLAIIIFISILYGIFSKVFIKPINQLNHAAKNMVSNLESAGEMDIQISTGDEIQELSETFNQMYVEVKDYIRKLAGITAEKERIGAELDVAKNIQASMLPCIFPAFPDKGEFDIFATMTPAKEVGGDFYDFFLIDDDHLALIMADVSGKGVPAALFMVIAKTLLKNAVQNGLSPKEVLETVNNQLCENNEAGMFVTVWIGTLEISTGKMTCANAGHEYPAIKRRDGAFELFKDKHGFVLAGMENVKYREYELLLQAGDKLFVYTDGVTEATDAQNKLFGTDRMLASLNRVESADCRTLLSNVHSGIDAFVGSAAQFDDITMLAIEMNEKNRLTLTPNESSIKRVFDFVENMMQQAGVETKIINRVNIAVDEIYTNIVRYSGAQWTEIICDIQNDKILLTFTDNGKEYNPLTAQEPDVTLSAEDREIGGLGIYMVKKSMDELRYDYKDGRNVVTIVKNR